jgi:hypothetical protein
VSGARAPGKSWCVQLVYWPEKRPIAGQADAAAAQSLPMHVTGSLSQGRGLG